MSTTLPDGKILQKIKNMVHCKIRCDKGNIL